MQLFDYLRTKQHPSEGAQIQAQELVLWRQ